MNPFREFGHFIAVFVPGVVLFVQLVMLASIVTGKNFMTLDLSAVNFFVVLIGGTILGLFLDEARHEYLEGKLEQDWADSKGIDLDKLDDFASYTPKMTPEIYRLIRDETFYFYEFDINIAFALWISAVVLVFYFDRFVCVGIGPGLGFVTLLVVMGFFFYRFGIGAYRYFLDTFVATMDTVEFGFVRRISKTKKW